MRNVSHALRMFCAMHANRHGRRMDRVDPKFYTYLYELLDGYTAEYAPGGVTEEVPGMKLTNMGYTYYVHRFGVPKTANECRHMFEWAAALEQTYQMVRSISANET